MKLKNLAVIIISAIMTMVLYAFGVTVYSSASDSHDDNHDGITWTAWESTDSLPSTTGSYYLTADVYITNGNTKIDNNNAVDLCLNGYSIYLQGKTLYVDQSAVRPRDTSLKIYNCDDEKECKITTSTTSSSGSCIYVDHSLCTLEIHGANITVSNENGRGIQNGRANSGNVYIEGKADKGDIKIIGGTYGIYTQDSSGSLTVKKAEVQATAAKGIAINSHGEISVDNSTVTGVDRGITLYQAGSSATTSKTTTIANAVISATAPASYGIYCTKYSGSGADDIQIQLSINGVGAITAATPIYCEGSVDIIVGDDSGDSLTLNSSAGSNTAGIECKHYDSDIIINGTLTINGYKTTNSDSSPAAASVTTYGIYAAGGTVDASNGSINIFNVNYGIYLENTDESGTPKTAAITFPAGEISADTYGIYFKGNNAKDTLTLTGGTVSGGHNGVRIASTNVKFYLSGSPNITCNEANFSDNFTPGLQGEALTRAQQASELYRNQVADIFLAAGTGVNDDAKITITSKLENSSPYTVWADRGACVFTNTTPVGTYDEEDGKWYTDAEKKELSINQDALDNKKIVKPLSGYYDHVLIINDNGQLEYEGAIYIYFDFRGNNEDNNVYSEKESDLIDVENAQTGNLLYNEEEPEKGYPDKFITWIRYSTRSKFGDEAFPVPYYKNGDINDDGGIKVNVSGFYWRKYIFLGWYTNEPTSFDGTEIPQTNSGYREVTAEDELRAFFSGKSEGTLYAYWKLCDHDDHDEYWTYSDNGNGTHNKKCQYCLYETTETHTMSQWASDGDGENGTHSRFCTKNCGYTEKNKHTFMTTPDDEYTQEHKNDEGVSLPTCTQSGMVYYKCETCDGHKLAYVAELGHDFKGAVRYEKIQGDSSGHYKYVHCTRCSEEERSKEAHDAPKHTDGTCIDRAKDEYNCTKCHFDETVYGNIDENNHDYDLVKWHTGKYYSKEVWVAGDFSDGKEAGTDYTKHWHVCKRCGNRTNIEGHNPQGDPIIDPKPTCMSTGLRSYKCKDCLENINGEVIPKDDSAHLYAESWSASSPYCGQGDPEKGHVFYCIYEHDYEYGNGESYQHKHDKYEHHSGNDWEWHVTLAATCTQDGEQQRICGVCGLVDKQTIYSDHKHVYEGDETYSYYDKDQHEKTVQCKWYGDPRGCTATEKTIEDHTITDEKNRVDPTCVATGSHDFYCPLCKENIDGGIIPADGKTHIWVKMGEDYSWETEDNLRHDVGSDSIGGTAHWYVCIHEKTDENGNSLHQICGQTDKTNPKIYVQHQFIEATVTNIQSGSPGDYQLINPEQDTPADCLNKAEVTVQCTVCKEHQRVEYGNFGDHVYGDWEYKDEETHKRSCTVCKDPKADQIKPHGDDGETPFEGWDNWTECKDEAHKGKHSQHCDVCDATVYEDHDIVWDDEYNDPDSKKPDCITGEDGWKIGKCSKCDYETKQDVEWKHTPGDEWTHIDPITGEKNKNNHWQKCAVCGKAYGDPEAHKDYIEWDKDYLLKDKGSIEPDCRTESNGWQVGVCSKCGYDEALLEIDWEHTPGDDWTYIDPQTEQPDEHNHWQICAVCDKAYGDPEAHDFEWDEEYEDSRSEKPYCGTPDSGKQIGVCKKCDYEAIRTTSADHTPSGNWSQYDPDGKKDTKNHWDKCAECGQDFSEPHNMREQKIKDSTTTVHGEIRHWCENCEYQYIEYLPLVGDDGDDDDDDDDKKDPTTRPPTSGDDDDDDDDDTDTDNDTDDDDDDDDDDDKKPENSFNDGIGSNNDNKSSGTPLGEGRVIVGVESIGDAPDISIGFRYAQQLERETIKKHITDIERATVEKGTDIEIILTVENVDKDRDITAEDRELADIFLANSTYTEGQYLDVSIIKYMNDVKVGKIIRLDDPIAFSLEIPEELRSPNRSFAVVRLHSGRSDLLYDLDSDPDTITLLSDRFSTYVIVYRDYAPGTDANGNPYTGGLSMLTFTLPIGVLAFIFNKSKIR